MIAKRLKAYLEAEGVLHTVISHPQAFTAQEVAAATHVHGKDLAKSVIVKGPDGFSMVVLPAHHRVDLVALARAMEADQVRLATEEEFEDLFPECEVGAMPPFGNLYGLSVIVSEPLTWDEEIYFNCGTHTEVIRMAYADFARLVAPRVANVSYVAGASPTRRSR